ncbi:PREDICTED: enolase-phosphatase E1-like isoform X2 [Branchiostoma belcheri]|uniref:Enolase-phosphatase E1-like isoform X2 n=1 Tax=Branchiostoma belcheri TaxID=7741 RepID=A0A6P4ZFA0_BRABE|nr:PREDICTED: enolase-phosphatase E1-like isoform X2 [Branchiostoma belcheri]
MADSVTEAVTSAPAGEPGEVAARGKDALEKRPKDNRHTLHNGAPTPAVLPNDVLGFLEVAMPGTFPADAAGGTPVVTATQEANESVSVVSQITKEPTNAPKVVETQVTQKHTGETQETPVHKKAPVTKPDTSSVGLSPEVLNFLDLTLLGVAEPEMTEDGSQAAPATPDTPEPNVTTSYTVRDRVPQASSAASVEPKIADEVVVQDMAEEAATARQEIPPQITQPAVDVTVKVTPTTVKAEEEEAKAEVQKTEAAAEDGRVAAEVDLEEVSELAVEEVNMAQEVVYQEELAAVQTVPQAQEDVHKEKEAPKVEVEDIAPAKTAEPEEKPPVAVVEEPVTEVTESAAEVDKTAKEVTELAAEVEKPAKEVKETTAEVTTEPGAEVKEPAAAEVTESTAKPATEVTESAAEAKEPTTEVEEPATEAEEAAAVTITENASEPEKTQAEAVEEAAPTADADKAKKSPVAANTEWTEEQVKEWSKEGYVPMVKNMFLPSTMPVLPSPLFYIGVGALAILVFYLTESPIMALMTLVLVLVLILLARLFYLYRLHGRCAEESAGKKKSE